MLKRYLKIFGILFLFASFLSFGYLEAKQQLDDFHGQEDISLKENEHPLADKPYLILCFGDDFTYDAHNSDKESYPHQLEKILNERLKGKFIVYNFGRMMSGLPDMVDLIKKYVDEFHPDYLTLMIGADNKWSSPQQSKTEIDGKDALKLKDELAKLNYGPKGSRLSMHSKDGFFARRQKLLTESAQDLKKILEQNPNNDEAREALATKYVEQKKYKLAIKQLRAIIKLNPDDIWMHEKLGTIYENLGNHTLAKKHFKEGVRIDPWNGHCHRNLGIACLQLGQKKLGIKHLTIANKIKKMNLNNFKQDITAVFNIAKNLNCKLILLKYPWRDKDIDPIIDKAGKKWSILVVDSYQPKFKKAWRSKNTKDYFFADGFLTPASNFIIAQAVYEKIRENLYRGFK